MNNSNNNNTIHNDNILANIPNNNNYDVLDKIKNYLFPLKIWFLATDPNFTPINWDISGNYIIIKVQELQPFLSKISRSNNFNSFIRQLNLYGFRKFQHFNSKGFNIDKNIVQYYKNGFNRDNPNISTQ